MRYPKECVLKDCREVTIRPMTPEDEAALFSFYNGISEKDRWYMRYNVSDKAVLKKWIRNTGRGMVESIVTVCDNRIVGHASLHTRGFGSTRHVGRFRILIHPDFRDQRLGTWLVMDIIQLAMDKGLETLRADLTAGPEDGAIDAMRKLDFFKRAEIKNYAKGPDGSLYNMVIMIKRLYRRWSDF